MHLLKSYEVVAMIHNMGLFSEYIAKSNSFE